MMMTDNDIHTEEHTAPELKFRGPELRPALAEEEQLMFLQLIKEATLSYDNDCETNELSITPRQFKNEEELASYNEYLEGILFELDYFNHEHQLENKLQYKKDDGIDHIICYEPGMMSEFLHHLNKMNLLPSSVPELNKQMNEINQNQFEHDNENMPGMTPLPMKPSPAQGQVLSEQEEMEKNDVPGISIPMAPSMSP